MGDLHGKVPSYAEDMSRENSLRVVKFDLDHKWTGNPDPGHQATDDGDPE
jgi:hypothetical protein